MRRAAPAVTSSSLSASLNTGGVWGLLWSELRHSLAWRLDGSNTMQGPVGPQGLWFVSIPHITSRFHKSLLLTFGLVPDARLTPLHGRLARSHKV